MGFHVATEGIPLMGTYPTAKFVHDNIEPIRGRGINRGRRPLASRRATHMTIRFEEGVASPSGVRGDAVICRLYQTDCVTFFESGEVRISLQGYDTVSTRLFINAVLLPRQRVSSIAEGDSLYSTYSYPTPITDVLREDYVVPKEQQYMFSDHVDLKVDGIPIRPNICVIHSVNRKAMSSVRKLYAPFIRYATAMLKIGYAANVGLDIRTRENSLAEIKETGIEYWPGSMSSTLFTYENSDFLCRVMRHDDKKDWANALQAMAMVTMVPAYSAGRAMQYFYRPDHMMQAFKEAPKYAHRDQVFVCKELPLGQYKKNPNLKYINSL